MLKKSIIPVSLLSIVVMLSVFYIKQTPSESNEVKPASNNEEVTYDFAKRRMEKLEERSNIINDLEKEIISSSASVTDIENVMNKINSIYYLKYDETDLEENIKKLGYKDSLVIIDDKNVNVTLVLDELTAKDFIDVANVVKTKFDNNYKLSIESVKVSNV